MPEAIAPHDVVQPTRFAGMGPTVDAKALTDERMRLGLEQWFLEGVLWGLGNPKAFETWYRSHTEHHMKNLEFMQQAGLAVEAPLDFQQFFANREDLVRSHERDVGPLGAIPERLRAFGGGASATELAALCRATRLSRTSVTPMKDKMTVAALIARHGQTLPRWII